MTRSPLFLPDFALQTLDLGTTEVFQVTPYDWQADGQEELLIARGEQILLLDPGENLLMREWNFSFAVEQFLPFRSVSHSQTLFLIYSQHSLYLTWTKGNSTTKIKQFPSQVQVQLFGQVLLDLNQDSITDLLLPLQQGFSWKYAIFLWHQDTFVFQEILASSWPGVTPPRAIPGQFTENHPQLAISLPQSTLIYRLFPSKLVKRLDWPFAGRVLAADLNHQNNKDFIVTSVTQKQLAIQIDGREEFFLSLEADRQLGSYTKDFNGDGWLDIVTIGISNPSWSKGIFSYLLFGKVPFAIHTQVFFNQQGVFSQKESFHWHEQIALTPHTTQPPQWLGCVDLNEDSYQEVVVASSDNIQVYYNLGSDFWLQHRQFFLHHLQQQVWQKIYETGLVGLPEQQDLFLALPWRGFQTQQLYFLASQGRHQTIVVWQQQQERSLLLFYKAHALWELPKSQYD